MLKWIDVAEWLRWHCFPAEQQPKWIKLVSHWTGVRLGQEVLAESGVLKGQM